MGRGRTKETKKLNVSGSGEEDVTNREILNQIKELKKSLEFMSNKFEEIRNENMELKKLVNENNIENQKLKERITRLEYIIEKEETEKIENNIAISGIDKQGKNENVKEIVNKVFQGMGINIKDEHITTICRKGNENGPIIVSLQTREIKEKILEKRKIIKSIDTNDCQLKGKKQIYINDQLTTYGNQLFYKARQLKKEGKVKYVWTRDGHIYVRKTDTTEKQKIKNETDIDKF